MQATPASRAYWHRQWNMAWETIRRVNDPTVQLALTILLRLSAHTAALADEWPTGYGQPAARTVPLEPHRPYSPRH